MTSADGQRPILDESHWEENREKYEKAVQLCERRTLAIDVGAHQGMWTSLMAGDFDRVAALEPLPRHASELHRRCSRLAETYPCKLEVLQCAAGAGRFRGRMRTHGDNDGQWHVKPEHKGPVHGFSLDELAVTYGWYEPALVKLDVEGMELEALAGSTKLLQTYRPVVVVELEPELLARYCASIEDVVEFLSRLSYRCVHSWRRDALFVPIEDADG